MNKIIKGYSAIVGTALVVLTPPEDQGVVDEEASSPALPWKAIDFSLAPCTNALLPYEDAQGNNTKAPTVNKNTSIACVTLVT